MSIACDFAEHVLHIYEAAFPGDDRVRNCIKATRRFINDEITEDELHKARREVSKIFPEDIHQMDATCAAKAVWFAGAGLSDMAGKLAAGAAQYGTHHVPVKEEEANKPWNDERNFQEERLRYLVEKHGQ